MDSRAVIFDFDGVIVDSSALKHQIFVDLAAQELLGEELDEALRKELSGAERYQVAEWLAQRSRGKIDRDAFLQEFAFSLKERLSALSLVDGFREYLGFLRSKRIMCFIVSAAPISDIKLILDKQNIQKSDFEAIYGSEHGKKVDIFKMIFRDYTLEARDLVFFGDMPSDYRVARELNVRFIRVLSRGGALCSWSNEVEMEQICDFRSTDLTLNFPQSSK